jgi:FixJ family two-component response regulator
LLVLLGVSGSGKSTLLNITGAEFVRQVRQVGGEVQAVVISACTDDRTIREARDAGATFLAKPVDYLLLSRLVREAGPAACIRKACVPARP